MNKSKYIHKDHNVSVLLYHLVFPAKYRRAVLTDKVDAVIKNSPIMQQAVYAIPISNIIADNRPGFVMWVDFAK